MESQDFCAQCGAAQRLRRQHVLVTILLTFVTLGIYLPIWFLRRRKGLNTLKSGDELPRTPFVVALGLLVAQAVVDIVWDAENGPALAVLVSALASLAYLLILVIQAFRVRTMLQRHLLEIGHADPDLSWVWTFFFSIWYLQHIINSRVLQPTSSVRFAH